MKKTAAILRRVSAAFSAAFSAATVFVRSLATNLRYFFRSTFLPQTKFIIADHSSFIFAFKAAQIYLPTKINNNYIITNGQQIADQYDGIPLQWRFNRHNRHFELNFPSKFEHQILNSYLPFVRDTARQIQIKIKKQDPQIPNYYSFQYPPTFDTLVIDPELKQLLIDDLDQFVRNQDFYGEARKPWKRSYLLSGPGTGKSILIDAIANYIRFDVFRYHISEIYANEIMQRDISSASSHGSSLVIVDMDDSSFEFTLSEMLVCLNALWSNCGDERIMILTTNQEDRLDPPLLEGIDVHLNMLRGVEKLPMKYRDIKKMEFSHHGIESTFKTNKNNQSKKNPDE